MNCSRIPVRMKFLSDPLSVVLRFCDDYPTNLWRRREREEQREGWCGLSENE